ncbi:hypothetical protein PBRA_005135 [Plasmodiophora brassicae]|nr:hypothetical protein PBRA_005135 [Plasmodiophora brassicae]
MDWFDKGDGRRVVDFVNRDVVEVGCGTGLVGLALALLGARSVVLTDQEPVMDIVQSSIDGNVVDGTATWVSAHPLYWGDDVPDALRGKDIIVGADLIFAHENIPLLLRTFSALCTDRSQTIVFAHINRFAWEPGFFTGMASAGFRQETVLVDGDVTIFRFTRCGGAPLLS